MIFSGVFLHTSPIMRKPTFCTCENKDAAQLRSNCEAYQRLCFSYTDNTIPLLSKSKISSSVLVQLGLCWTCWFSHAMVLMGIHVLCMPRAVHRKSQLG